MAADKIICVNGADGKPAYFQFHQFREDHHKVTYFSPDCREVAWVSAGEDTVHICGKNQSAHPNLARMLIETHRNVVTY